MVARGLRHAAASSSSQVAEALCAQLRPRAHDARSATRSAGRSTPSACSTSAPRRSCSCCSATSAGPAAASWRCAGTRASRARPTSRRCSTSCPATSRCRTRTQHHDLDDVRRADTAPRRASGATCDAYMRQPAQGVVGRRARPRTTTSASTTCRGSTGDHSHLPRRCCGMLDGEVQGLLRGRREPGGRLGQRASCSGSAWRTWTGSSCATCAMIETRDVLEGRPGDRDRRAAHRGHRHRGVLPARRRAHREGRHFTNTQRLLQWHHKAVEPPGDCRSELWFYYHLGRRIREKLAGSTDPRDRPLLDLTWDYPTDGPHDEPERRGGAARDQRLRTPTAAARRRYTELKDDGSTACGCWIYCGVYADERQPGRAPQARAASRPGSRPSGAGRGRRTAASSTTAPRPTPTGRPWSERKKLRLVGRRAGQWTGPRRARLHADQAARLRAARGRAAARTRIARRRAVHHAGRRPRLAVRARPGSPTARCRRTTSRRSRRSTTRSTASRRNPARAAFDRARQPATTRRRRADGLPVRVHDLPADRAPHRGRHEPLAAVPGRAAAGDVLRGLAASWPPSAGSSTAAGRRSSPRARRSRRGCWSPTGCAPLRVAGPRRPPDRAAVPLGPQRAQHRRLGQRPVRARARPERAHPGVQGADLRHPARAGVRAGRRCASSSRYRRRAGIADGMTR